jgi:hypothetical protein
MTIAVGGGGGYGIDVYQLEPSEVGTFKAKVPLSPTEFNYPITNIVIEIGSTSIEVDPDEYTVVNGNLYFYKTLSQLISDSINPPDILAYGITNIPDFEEDYIFFASQGISNYKLKVYFATIVPYTGDGSNFVTWEDTHEIPVISGMPDYLEYSQFVSETDNYQPRIDPFFPDIIDTTSNDLARTALAQTTSYAISDYFNQYYTGYTDATDHATRDYTVLVTFWSTLISTLVMLPLTAYTMAAQSTLSFVQALGVGTIGIIPGVISEIYEELYVDPHIEAFFKKVAYETGGDEGFWNLIGMAATSLREAFTGGTSGMIDAAVNIDTNTDAETILTTQAQQDQNIATGSISSQIWEFSKSNIGTILGIATAIPGFFLGGAGIGIMSTALDLSSDFMQDKLKQYYLKKNYVEEMTLHAEQYARLFDEELPSKPVLSQETVDKVFAWDKKKQIQAEVEVIPSPMPDLMHPYMGIPIGPAPMISMGPIEFNHDHIKENIKKIDDLKGKVSGELDDIQNELDSVELKKLDDTLNTYKHMMYEGHEIFVDVGPYGGVNYRVTKKIIDKSARGETLTELERFILSETAIRMGGKKAPILDFDIKIWRKEGGFDSPYLSLFEDFVNNIKLTLLMYEVVELHANRVTDSSIESIVKGARITDIRRDMRASRHKTPNIGEKHLELWYVRIENEIINSPRVIEQYKKTAITDVKKLFNDYYLKSGYTSLNPVYRGARNLIFKIGEVLLNSDKKLIKANTVDNIRDVLGSNIDSLYKGLKFKSHYLPRLGEGSAIESLRDGISSIDKSLTSEEVSEIYSLIARFEERVRDFRKIRDTFANKEEFTIEEQEDSIQSDIQEIDLKSMAKTWRERLIMDLQTLMVKYSDHVTGYTTIRGLSRLLFGEGTFISQNFWHDKTIASDNPAKPRIIDRRPELYNLYRMKLYANTWTTMNFEKEGMSISHWNLEELKTEVLSKIDEYIFS